MAGKRNPSLDRCVLCASRPSRPRHLTDAAVIDPEGRSDQRDRLREGLSRMRVGIVGVGAIARYYLPALVWHPEVELAVVCDRDPAKARQVPPGVVFVEDLRLVLADRDVDAIVVTLPNDLHHAVCRDALLAGKHVCCEKPLTVDPEDAAELDELAAATGRTLFTAFHRRYNHHALALADRLRHRVPPRRAELTYRELIQEHCDSDAWYLDPARCGGGCVIDNGSNAFDLALWLLGPLRLQAALLEYSATGADQQAIIELDTEAHGTAAITLDWAFHGEDKAIRLEWDDGPGDCVDLLAGFAQFKSSLWHEYRGVVDDFVATALHGRGRQDTGRMVTELVAATYRAGRKTA